VEHLLPRQAQVEEVARVRRPEDVPLRDVARDDRVAARPRPEAVVPRRALVAAERLLGAERLQREPAALDERAHLARSRRTTVGITGSAPGWSERSEARARG